MLPESPLARDASLSSWRSGVQFPSGALRNRCRPNGGVDSNPAVAVKMERSFSPSGTPGVIARRSVSLPATPQAIVQSRRCFVRNSQVQILSVASSIENIPDKGSTRVFPTPGPASTVFRSPSLISWPSSWSLPSPQEPEVRVRIPAVEFPPWCNLEARCRGSSNFPATPVPVAQSGQSTGLRSRVSHVRIVPGTSSRARRGWARERILSAFAAHSS